MINQKNSEEFFLAYVECAFWSSIDEDSEELTGGLTDLSPEAHNQMMMDCGQFINDNSELLNGLDMAQCGHDFWLTRNNHGAGFWDRGLGELGDKLTDTAESFGECHLYYGDDGLVYIE